MQRQAQPDDHASPQTGAPEPVSLDDIVSPARVANVTLASGRSYELTAGAETDRVTIRARTGEIVLRIDVGDAGPVLSFTGASVELCAAKSLRLAAEEVAIDAGTLRERVAGDHHLQVGGDERVEAANVQLQANVGAVAVRAMGRIALDGEHIGLNDDPLPQPFGWSAIAADAEEAEPPPEKPHRSLPAAGEGRGARILSFSSPPRRGEGLGWGLRPAPATSTTPRSWAATTSRSSLPPPPPRATSRGPGACRRTSRRRESSTRPPRCAQRSPGSRPSSRSRRAPASPPPSPPRRAPWRSLRRRSPPRTPARPRRPPCGDAGGALEQDLARTALSGVDPARQARAALPFARTALSAQAAAPPMALLTYASLCAELAVAPEKAAEILARYHVPDEASRRARSDEHRQAQLATQADARGTFDAAVTT